MTKKTKVTLIAIPAIIIVTILAIFIIKKTSSGGMAGGPMGPGGMGMGPGGAGGRGSSIVTVSSTVAEVKTLDDYVITNGEVESQSAIEVYPSMSGKISEVNVILGSHVNKGDIVAKVDPSEPGTRYALSPVEAPIGGSIVSTPLKTGTKVSSTTAVTMIGDIENLQITAPIPERYIAELKTGLHAEVTLEAYPGVIFDATVSRVSPVVDKTSRTKEIILNFDKKDSRINAGMFAKVKLFTSKYAGKIVVPKDSVVSDDADSYLYIVSADYKAEKRSVKTGKSVDTSIQITEGLKEGERVVVEGMLSLSDGASVKDISNPDSNAKAKEAQPGEGGMPGLPENNSGRPEMSEKGGNR